MDYKVWSKPRQVHNAAIVWGVLCTPCAKVASNYVKISSSPLNPNSKVINCLRENMSPKEPNELWWLCKLFFKRESCWQAEFSFFVRFPWRGGGLEVFKAWDWMLHYARAAGSRFNPDQTENLSNASIRLMSGRSFLFLSISFHPHLSSLKRGLLSQAIPCGKVLYNLEILFNKDFQGQSLSNFKLDDDERQGYEMFFY